MVYTVKDIDDFKGQIKAAGDKLVVVDFFATWCGPCKVIAPYLEELSNTFAEKILVIKVDVDECEDVALEYGIASMPTFVFIKNETTLTTFSGANKDKLKATITELAA